MGEEVFVQGMLAGDIELGEALGKGGFAVTHACQDPQGTMLAAKIYKEQSDSGLAPASALHEAEMLRAASGSPYIIRTLGLVQVPLEPLCVPDAECATRWALLMERCDCSLHELLGVRLAESESAFVMKGVFSGLRHLHSRYILHGDVQPANILISGCGNLVLSDLGLSQSIFKGTVTPKGGSHGYISPEALQENQCGLAADLFAAGAVLYLLLFRTPAFQRQTPIESRVATLMGQLPLLPCGKAVGKSEASCDLVRQLLAFLPESRPTAEEALEFSWLQMAGGIRSLRAAQTKMSDPKLSSVFSEPTTTPTPSRKASESPKARGHVAHLAANWLRAVRQLSGFRRRTSPVEEIQFDGVCARPCKSAWFRRWTD